MGFSRPAETKKKTIQRAEAPVWASEIFPTAGRSAMNLYSRGIGGQVYGGPRVAPLSPQTLSAISDLQNVSRQYNNPYLTSLVSRPTVTAANLSNMASGQMMNQNPYFNQAIHNAMRDASTMVNQAMSGAGRYGSGAHTGTLAGTLGDIATQARAAQYNQDLQNMMRANAMIDQANLAQLAGAGGLYQGRGAAAANALRGASAIDLYTQRLADAARQQFMETQQAPWMNLNRFVGTGRAISDPYRTQYGSISQIHDPGNDPWKNIGTVGLTVGGMLGGIRG